MVKKAYVAKKPNEAGNIDYDQEENAVWKILFERQLPLIKNRACDEFFLGLSRLGLNGDKIPQCAEISKSLKQFTNWSVAPVKALISFKEFFELLEQRIFPAASFIRRRDDLDYLMEPDIFHEIFGHCPLLTNKNFANFTHEVGKFGVTLSKEDRPMLARLYWFTVEFGLLKTLTGMRIYGAGILSSKTESIYALEDPSPQRLPFNLLQCLRTPYRYDQLQRSYFVVEHLDDLYGMIDGKLVSAFKEAKELGMLPDPYQQIAPLEDVRSC